MHITRAKVDQYGPLRDIDYDLDSSFHLFYGKNESGKTLLVESLIKLLLADENPPFDGVDRVSQTPAGFVAIETDHGDEILLPDQGYDTAFPELTPRDLRNAFVIRDFDLRVPRKQDFGNAEYFREVTDRITGAETQKIEGIRNQLQDIGHLTSNSSNARLVNRKNRSPPKLKDKRDTAQKLVDRMQTYRDEARHEGVLEKARRKRQAEQELATVEQELTQLEKAEDQAQLNRGRDLLGQLKDVRQELQELDTKEQTEIEDYSELQDQIGAYREQQKNASVSPTFYRNGLAVTATLLALSLAATILSPLNGLNVIAGILLLGTAGFGYKYWEGRKRAKQADDLVTDANHAGVPGDSLPEVDQELEERIDTFTDRQQELNREEERLVTQLQELFDADIESTDQWERELDEFEEEIEQVDTTFDEDRLQTLSKRQSDLEEEIQQLDEALREHEQTLADFDSDVAGLPLNRFVDVDDPRVQSIADIDPMIDHLQEFVSAVNTRVDTATTAIEIFEEIEEEEEREINHLFDDDSYAVQFFADASNGNYTDIRYDETDNVVRVTRADGRELTADQLSQGTYDLLYMAIRLKLARDLLGDQTGFLILDDAFLHSDPDRIHREIDILKDLANDGWQIIYFSIRNPVRDAVETASLGRVEELPQLNFNE